MFSALAVAVLSEVLFTMGGSAVPERSDLYGAPFPVGESGGLNVLFTAGFGSFLLPIWIINVLITAVVLLAGAIVLEGTMAAGLIAASIAVGAAYVIALMLPGSEYRSNQLAIWAWMVLAVLTVWGINRLRRRSLNR